MIEAQKVIEIAEKILEGSDMFVVDCKASPAGEIELLIDSDTAVKLDDCARINRAIEAELDREVEDYSLLVASAGIGSELKLLRQYRKILGGSVVIGRAKYISEEEISKFDDIFKTMNTELKAITEGGSDDV